MNGGINLAAIYIADGMGAILSVIMLGAHIWTRDKNNNEVKMFRMMLVTTLMSCLADIVAFMFDGKPGLICFLLLYISNTWLFISNVILGSLWIMTVITHISGRGLPGRQKVLLYVLDSIGCITLVINLFSPVVFNVDSNNVYSRGPLFWLYIVIELLVLIDSFIVYILYRKRNPDAKHFPIWQFIIPVLAGIVIQSFFYGLSLICPSLSIAVCGVILGIFSENEEAAEILKQNEMKSKIIIEQQEQLEDALQMAQSANKSKTTFLNNMSHDIRTPMNAIIGYTGLAKRHIGNKEQVSDYLDKIGRSSDYLLSLINEVLDMSRIESGKMTLSVQAESLSEIIDSIRDIVQADIRARKHNFSIVTEGIEHDVVRCDKLRLKQILINILSNSIKYTPENGTIVMRITERTQQKETLEKTASYEFCVSDTGIGMDEEYMAIMFEPFTRVKSSTVSGIQGTGLGMAITKNLIDMMGGEIKVTSKLNQGTTTVMTFDFEIAEVSEIVVNDTEKAIDDIRGRCRGRKVLLVEDNELNREIATQILTEGGLTVETANDGNIAVERMKEAGINAYDLILMDIQMPKMDGYEATRLIRAVRPVEEHIPIIAMTANAFDEDRKLAIDAGMDDYLAKPIDIDNLFRVMNKYIS